MESESEGRVLTTTPIRTRRVAKACAIIGCIESRKKKLRRRRVS